MRVIILLLISILPIFLIGYYVYKHDNNKEPKRLLIKLFIYGMLSCIPAIILELIIELFFKDEILMNLPELFIFIFIDVALIEEICKWLMTYKISYNNPEFNQIYDTIVYAVSVSLGFAAFENIFYVLDSGYLTGLLRAIFAIPGHTCDAIIMGRYLGLAKEAKIKNNKKLEKKNLILSILLPSLAHTIYDFCISAQANIFIYIFLIVILWVYIYSIRKIKYISKKNYYLKNKELFCPNCQSKNEYENNFCTKCGDPLSQVKINNSNNLTNMSVKW